MIKLVYCVRRLAGMDPERFRKYWLEQHGPLVRQCAETLRARRYVQSHTLDAELNELVRAPRSAAEPYDGITEVWWDSREDLLAATGSPEGEEAARKLLEDERNFIDFERSTVFFTEEHTIFDE